ncbi:hypothetical protein AAVH_17556 [Aphelenchoides avenae]|nr:hypothetical protein AAVH_17556 [Aphelenchus avenae]
MLSFEDQLLKPSFGEELMTVCLMEEGKSGVKAHRVHLAFTDPQTWSKDQWITSPNLSSLDDGLAELENRLRHSTVDVIILYKLALHPVHAQSLHEMARSFRRVSSLEIAVCDVTHLSPDHLGQLIDFCPRRVQLGLSGTSTEHLQLSDEFLVKYVGKIKRLNICGSGSSRFTEQGVLEFIFQESAEWVILQVDSTTITSSFPSRLLQRAQQSTALNEIHLLLRHGAWDAANDHLPGMQDFGDYRTWMNNVDDDVEYKLPPAGQVQLSLELKQNTLRFDRILLKRSGQE